MESIIHQRLEAILATTARLLVRTEKMKAASILANAEPSLTHWDHDNWNGGQDTWQLLLAIPTDTYLDLNREAIESEINEAISIAVAAVSDADFIITKIMTRLDDDPDWRRKTMQYLSGDGVNNQGRVRSDNVAARQHDGLLFRSSQEILFYDALKRSGVPFAPLAVILRGGDTYRRVEPDFLIMKNGLSMVVEIDGDLFHTESPASAHGRLKFLTDENVRLERISASDCDTPEKARDAVKRILATIEKLLRA